MIFEWQKDSLYDSVCTETKLLHENFPLFSIGVWAQKLGVVREIQKGAYFFLVGTVNCVVQSVINFIEGFLLYI